jgi:hypothetical protein
VGGLGEMFLTEGRKSLWKGEITLFLGKWDYRVNDFRKVFLGKGEITAAWGETPSGGLDRTSRVVSERAIDRTCERLDYQFFSCRDCILYLNNWSALIEFGNVGFTLSAWENALMEHMNFRS